MARWRAAVVVALLGVTVACGASSLDYEIPDPSLAPMRRRARPLRPMRRGKRRTTWNATWPMPRQTPPTAGCLSP